MMTAQAKKLTVKSVAAGGIFCVLLFLVILPKASRVGKLAADVRTTLAENQKLQTSVLTPEHSGDRLDKIHGALAHYKTRALYQEDLTRVLDELGSMAQATRLNVVSLRALDEPRRIPGEPFVDGNFEIQQVMVSLRVGGKYPDLVQYFGAIEQLPYLTTVQKVMIKSESFSSLREGEDPQLSAEVMLAVLMRVPPILKK